MEDYFRKCTTRRVHRDRTVSLGGRLFEAPVGLIGKIIILQYHEHDPLRVEASYNDESHGMLVPLDVNINCSIRRGRKKIDIVAKEPDTPEEKLHYSGGKLFDRDKSDDEL
jgi:hypothetical protein